MEHPRQVDGLPQITVAKRIGVVAIMEHAGIATSGNDRAIGRKL
jgi:hypothetical protein